MNGTAEYTGGWVDPIYGNWKFTEFPKTSRAILFLGDIAPLLCPDRLIELPLDDIAYWGMNLPSLQGDNCSCCGGVRYRECDPKYPGIITNASNPFGKKYRLLDGKHRMQRLIHSGASVGKFYLFDFEELKPYFLLR